MGFTAFQDLKCFIYLGINLPTLPNKISITTSVAIYLGVSHSALFQEKMFGYGISCI